MGRHEIDRIRRGHLRGDHQIALVFTVLMIDQHKHAAIAGIVDDVLNTGNRIFPIGFNLAGVFKILGHVGPLDVADHG